MDLDSNLNFSEICRCCKRKSFQMTSIFHESVYPTYPSIKDMLRTIASLNIDENDGLPSLVCTSCIDNIQDAYTFILHLILVDEELWQILLARGKENYTLLQATYDSNQCISTESVKEEDESGSVPAGAENYNDDVNHSLIMEDLNEPTQNVDQHGPADNSYQNSNLVIQVVEQEQNKSVPKLVNFEQPQLNHQEQYAESYGDICESNLLNLPHDFGAARNVNGGEEENDEISQKPQDKLQKTTSNLNVVLHHTPDERKESSPRISLRLQELQDHEQIKKHLTKSVNNNNLLKVQRTVDMEDEDNEDGISEDSSESACKLESFVNNDESEVENVENFPEMRPNANALVFKCKLCTYTNAHRWFLKEHLQSHLKVKPFPCSKCHYSFTKKCNMVKHLQTCNGVISNYAHTLEARHKKKISRMARMVIPLTIEDLDDPAKMKQYYTVTGIDGQEQEDNCDVSRRKLSMFKCKLCAYSSTIVTSFKRHLTSHTNYKAFTCSKCNGTFTRNAHLHRHWKTCNGMIRKYARNERGKNSKKIISLTQNLTDPLKMMKKYYTVSACTQSDSETEQGKKGSSLGSASTFNNETHFNCDSTVIESSDVQDNDPKLRRNWRNRTSNLDNTLMLKKFKCNLCAFTTSHFAHFTRHREIHSKDTFTCSKCNDAFAKRGWLVRHLRKCNGEFKKENASKQVPSLKLTPQNLESSGDIIGSTSAESPGEDSEDVDYDDDNEDRNSEDSSDCDYTPNGNETKARNSSGRGRGRPKKAVELVYKCKLCAHTTAHMSFFKQHLLSHFKNKPFACPKCNGTFTQVSSMLTHVRKCNGAIRPNYKKQKGKQLIELTLQDLNDPLKLNKYYTVTGIHGENIDDVIKEQNAEGKRYMK